jgi:hypothetical protein
MPNDPTEPANKAPLIADAPSLSQLSRASKELKAKIAEAKARNDMPFDSTLGNPNWDKNAADGHLDVPDDDDDGWSRPPAKPDKPSPP